MLNPHDRRDLACLGLMVLVYGLAVAPVLHTVVEHGGGGHHLHAHAHERPHSHGPRGEHNGTGALAHARAQAHRHGDMAHPHGPQRDNTAHAHRHLGDATGHADAAPRESHDAPVEPDEQQDGHEHLTGSVEHLQAVALAWAALKLPRVRETWWLAEGRQGPSRAPGSAVRPTAMPQGP